MKRFRFLISCLWVALVMLCFWPTASVANADSQDERSMTKISDVLSSLWDFVDSSASVPDETFYPDFVTRAQNTRSEIDKAYAALGKTNETGRTKKAIEVLREDIQLIQISLVSWEDAATAKDSETFEDASYVLSMAVDEYNTHIDDYNHAAYGVGALAEVMLYVGSYVASLALTCLLFAWAAYRNNKTDDVAKEILRKLRWQAGTASLPVLAVATLPLCLYLFTENLLPVWAWCLMALSFAPLAFVLVRYFRVRRMPGRA
ncbi:MAG TPA: hypothetical protein VF809_00845 [Candidatus Saccharimonadales bacterium]